MQDAWTMGWRTAKKACSAGVIRFSFRRMRSMGLEFWVKAGGGSGGGWGLAVWKVRGGGVVLPGRPDLPRLPGAFLGFIEFRNAPSAAMMVKRTMVPLHELVRTAVVLMGFPVPGTDASLTAGARCRDTVRSATGCCEGRVP